MDNLKIKWLVFAVTGLLFIGAGLSMAIDAAIIRINNQGLQWIVNGTIGLLVFNTGICLFGQAIIYKVRLGDK